MLNLEGFILTLYKLVGENSDQITETLALSTAPHLSSINKAFHRS